MWRDTTFLEHFNPCSFRSFFLQITYYFAVIQTLAWQPVCRLPHRFGTLSGKKKVKRLINRGTQCSLPNVAKTCKRKRFDEVEASESDGSSSDPDYLPRSQDQSLADDSSDSEVPSPKLAFEEML